MKNFNIFNKNSFAYPLRWLVICSFFLVSLMGFANVIGWKLLTFNNQESWSASGPGSHK